MQFLLLVITLLSISQMYSFAQESEQQGEFVPSILLETVINRDLSGIQRALEAGENIDLVNDNGWSAARFAVSLFDLDMLQALIDAKIDLNNPDNEGFTPLMAAAATGDKEMVEMLLAGNASPLIYANDGSTAHSKAMESGRQLVALMIAEASALHGIDSDNLEAVLESLRQGAYANIRNSAGWTPLMLAAARGDVDGVREVMNFNPDANRTENDGWTALHFAASGGHEEIVEMLLKANADPSIRTVDGRTARQLAESEGFNTIVDIIPDVSDEAHQG